MTVNQALNNVTGFRLEVFAVGGYVGYADDGNVVLTEFTVDAVPAQGTAVLIE